MQVTFPPAHSNVFCGEIRNGTLLAQSDTTIEVLFSGQDLPAMQTAPCVVATLACTNGSISDVAIKCVHDISDEGFQITVANNNASDVYLGLSVYICWIACVM